MIVSARGAAVLTPPYAGSVLAADMVDLGAVGRDAAGALSALLAPVAMGLGALGLLGLWTLAPRAPDAATPSLRPAISPAALASQAPQAQPLERLLQALGAPISLTQPQLAVLTRTAAQTDAELRDAQAHLILLADQSAQSRLAAAGATFRAVGLNPQPYMDEAAAPGDMPAKVLKDPHAVAARLDIDPSLGTQAQHAVRDLIAARALEDAAASVPRAIPVDDPVRSSGFGIRIDPFTHAPAFHPGQDFSGHYGEAIHVTAPGVVSFVGQRTGYGNVVEVDHGHGFKTRYGHLSGFVLGVGAPVKTGDVIGRMGSTGRSTGVHVHYEVWASGHLENPARFLIGPRPSQRS